MHISRYAVLYADGCVSPTPAALPAAIPRGYQYDGQPVVIGARVYVPDNSDNSVDCFNYATNKSCPNFPHAFSNLGLLYTVNRDPFRPSCLWVNADDGADQIQNFDAFSAGTCADAPYRVFTAADRRDPARVLACEVHVAQHHLAGLHEVHERARWTSRTRTASRSPASRRTIS